MLIKTAYRMIKRSWRERELTLLLTSLTIALLCFTSINLLTKSIEMTMGANASELLGGNIVISSPTPIPKQWHEEALQHNLSQANSVNFMSVLSANNQWQLSSIKAIDSHYPLLGELKLGKTPYQHQPEIEKTITPSTILLESKLYDSLKINAGDFVQIGNTKLSSNTVLINDPITGRGFFNFSPKALISLDDLSKTEVIQPGSRIDYRWYLKGSEKDINSFSAWLAPKLNQTQRLNNANTHRSSLSTAFKRVDAILKVSILMALSLTAIAITISVRQYIYRQKKTMALLRSFGMSSIHVLLTYSIILLSLCAIGTSLGILLGIAVQFGINYALQAHLIMPTLPFTLLLIPRAFIMSAWLLACVSLPWLWQILHISPNDLLTEQTRPINNKQYAQWTITLLLIIGASYFIVRDWSLLRIIAGGYMIAIAILLMLTAIYEKVLMLCRHKFKIGYRYGLLNIVRHRWYTFSQITAFSLTLTTLLVLTLMSQSLLLEWEKRLAPDTPNYFVFNFTKDQANPLSKLITNTTDKAPVMYPMIRGRLTRINNKPVLDAIPANARNNNALHRSLNLSTTTNIPENNEITRGSWWAGHAETITSISVEEQLANTLGIRLGDELTFTIGATPVTGVVTNFRNVNWASLHPNFYFIFSPNTLSNFSETYISSFHLSNSKNQLLQEIVQTYPNITIIDIDDLINKIRTILTNIRYLILYLTGFILMAGIALLYSSVLATLDIRQNETRILTLLGAGPRIIKQSLIAEFGGLGLAASATAVLVAQLMLFSLSQAIGFLSYHWLWTPNVLTLIFGTIIIAAIGTKSTLRLL